MNTLATEHDFKEALQNQSASVGSAVIAKFLKWESEFGTR